MKLTRSFLTLMLWTAILIIAILSTIQLDDLILSELSYAVILIALLNLIRLPSYNTIKPIFTNGKNTKNSID